MRALPARRSNQLRQVRLLQFEVVFHRPDPRLGAFDPVEGAGVELASFETVEFVLEGSPLRFGRSGDVDPP